MGIGRRSGERVCRGGETDRGRRGDLDLGLDSREVKLKSVGEAGGDHDLFILMGDLEGEAGDLDLSRLTPTMESIENPSLVLVVKMSDVWLLFCLVWYTDMLDRVITGGRPTLRLEFTFPILKPVWDCI